MDKKFVFEGNVGVASLNHWKVEHPNVSNDIPQMRSESKQPYFCAGGNQTCYYLGKKSNAMTADPSPPQVLSRSERLQVETMKTIGRNVDIYGLRAMSVGSRHM
jgi:hypothetical protein